MMKVSAVASSQEKIHVNESLPFSCQKKLSNNVMFLWKHFLFAIFFTKYKSATDKTRILSAKNKAAKFLLPSVYSQLLVIIKLGREGAKTQSGCCVLERGL
jgi:hypothetical protein